MAEAARSASSVARPPGAGILTVGEELLDGRTLDTNGREIAEALVGAGLRVVSSHTVGDDPGAIGVGLEQALRGARVVVVTGGLGPTTDDRTHAAVARFVGQRLVRRADVLERIEERYRRRGRPMPRSNLRQAELPERARVLDNPIGTAPGALVRHRGKRIYVLPGVPSEMRRMLAESVLPDLADALPGARPRAQRTVRVVNLAESEIQDRVSALSLPAGLELAYRADYGEVDVRLLGVGVDARAVSRAAARVRRALGAHVFGVDRERLEDKVVAGLRAAGRTLAVAESCTGGLVSSRVTAVPGSSEVLLAGWVTYSNAAKRRDLGVPADLLRKHGAVSEAVARAMAEGARRRARSSHAVALTGIAGPGGGTPDKPVGIVWVAWAFGRETVAHRLRLTGSRERIRALSTTVALDGLRRELDGLPVVGG